MKQIRILMWKKKTYIKIKAIKSANNFLIRRRMCKINHNGHEKLNTIK